MAAIAPAEDEEEYELLDIALERSELPIPVSAPENGSLGESPAFTHFVGML